MVEWNTKKLEEYTENSKEIFKHKIDYKYLAENFQDGSVEILYLINF